MSLSLEHCLPDAALAGDCDATMQTTDQSSADTRPGLAMVVNVMAPYRLHLHNVIAAGIPEFKLHTLVTHDAADFDWQMDIPPSIHLRQFGSPGDSPVARPFHRPLHEWFKGGRLTEYLRQNDVRAVIMLGYRHVSYLRVIRHCHRIGLPLFIHNDSNIQGDRHLSPLKRRLKKRVYRWLMRRVAGVMSMGDLGDQFFLTYGADPGRIYRVPFVPDFDSFQTVDSSRLIQFRRKFGLTTDRKYLLFSGRLIPLKRVDLIIDAFAQIATQRPNWDLMIAGEGNLAEELRRRVPDSIRKRVIWTGFLDQDEPALACHAADVLLLASNRDAWGLVVLEAMAAGLTVVSSDVVGAAHELIVDGDSGRLYPAENLAELTRAMLEVTAADALPRFKDRSRAALARWRDQTNPVAEVRRALAGVGVLAARPQDATTASLGNSH